MQDSAQNLDGESFSLRMNPFDQARTPQDMACRKPGQGFGFGLIGKGSHEDTGWNFAHFMAAVVYGK